VALTGQSLNRLPRAFLQIGERLDSLLGEANIERLHD